VFNEFPTLLFLSLFSLQILQWGFSYCSMNHSIEVYKNRLKPYIVSLNVCMYLLQGLIWLFYFLIPNFSNGIFTLVLGIIYSIIFVHIAVLLKYYSNQVNIQTNSLSLLNMKVRIKQMRVVSRVSTILTFTLCIYGLILLVTSITGYINLNNENNELSISSILLLLILYLGFELVPMVTMMIYHRRVTTTSDYSRRPGVSNATRQYGYGTDTVNVRKQNLQRQSSEAALDFGGHNRGRSLSSIISTVGGLFYKQNDVSAETQQSLLLNSTEKRHSDTPNSPLINVDPNLMVEGDSMVRQPDFS